MLKVSQLQKVFVGHLFLTRSMGVASSAQSLQDKKLPESDSEHMSMKVLLLLYVLCTMYLFLIPPPTIIDHQATLGAGCYWGTENYVSNKVNICSVSCCSNYVYCVH